MVNQCNQSAYLSYLVALNTLCELHYDKRHLLDVIRRQQEEIDWTRNKIRDSGTLIDHLKSVKVIGHNIGQ